MARSSSAKSASGPARIRLVILEAETPDGDLSQVKEAVQNALRSSDGVTPMRRAITSIAQRMPPSSDSGGVTDAEVVEEAPADPPSVEGSTASPRPSRPRKGKTPTVLEVDLASGTSFEEYARPKNPTSEEKRFLVVAAWFKQHRGVDAITVDHVYTCYRVIKWPVTIPDFAQPLRNLKFRQLMDTKVKGQYSINHLGLAEVDKLGGG